ncbi:putative branched-subunit amino acid permease [Rhizobium sp. BIGb0125]|uniref:AzlC family ABC transporter permease n=1 Tax=Rhizobium sp. BIGb0125 TaxID=2940618 RepID=UPI00216A7268|nr:AzlC family ABC transporter permease [Rhizobium sp. BIGb0125]MCS4241227.1 putative branched-subunit amino acid permease [Rhizobium sp. BIGb0125]
MAHADFKTGLKGGFLIALSAAPFGLLFGAVAVDNGLTMFEAVLMSATLYAGASQLVGIELFGQKIEAWLVILSIFAVNFRHILYSAAMVRPLAHWSLGRKLIAFFFLVDPQFAESVRRNENGEKISFSWYMGFALAIYFPWLITTVLGVMFGKLIGDPRALGFDVLLPIYFMGMVLGFRKRQNFYPVMLASGIGAIVAFHVVGSPWHVSLGAFAGILVAVLLPPAPSHIKNIEEAGEQSL